MKRPIKYKEIRKNTSLLDHNGTKELIRHYEVKEKIPSIIRKERTHIQHSLFGIRRNNEVKTKMERKERPQIDVTPYVGTPAIIVKAAVEKGQFGLFVKLETGTVANIIGIEPLTATRVLGFTKDGTTNNYYIAVDSPMDKFLRAKQIDCSKIPDVITEGMELDAFHGIKVVCQKNAKGYLEIA